MKRMMILLVMALVMFTGNAFAAGSTDLTVQATVLGTCSFNAATYLMDFGSLDPAAAADTNATAKLEFTCSNGTTYNIDDVKGLRSMGGTGDSLPYTIAPYTITGSGNGLLQSVDLVGTVYATDYDIVSGRIAQAYSETFTININP